VVSSIFFFPRLISAVADWMSAILAHMALVRISDAGLKLAARGSLKHRMQKRRKNHHVGTIVQLCRAESSQLRHVSTVGKKLVK